MSLRPGSSAMPIMANLLPFHVIFRPPVGAEGGCIYRLCIAAQRCCDRPLRIVPHPALAVSALTGQLLEVGAPREAGDGSAG
jgi:hypothetical protein